VIIVASPRTWSLAGEAAVAAVGVLVEVGLERVELAGPRGGPAAVYEFLPGGGALVALDGVLSPAQLPGDLPDAPRLGPQAVDQGVIAFRALGELPRGLWCRLGR
jgi:hypothetical protein